jgi:hypothetical protein
MDFDYEKLAEAIRNGTPVGNRSIDVDAVEKELDNFKKSLNAQVKELNKAQPGWKALSQNLAGNSAAGKDFGYSLKRIQTELESYDEAIKKATETATDAAGRARVESLEASKQEVVKAQKATESAAAYDAAKTATMNFGTGLTKMLGTTLIQGASQFIKGLQSGQDGVELYGNAAKAAAQATTDGFGMAGDAIGGVGQALTGLGGKVALVGVALQLLGPLIKGVSAMMGKVAQEGLDVLQKEVQKTQKAFKDASASGAMFADGMSGLRDSAHKAGLTTDQFAEVLKNQSANIAASGLGMTEGMKRLGDVKAAMKRSGIEASLMNLGYGFKEQAELVAETQANIARSGAGSGTTEEVARQTKAYAENLRLVSNLTGEDAKAKMKQVQNENQILAFQNKIAELGPEQRAQIDAAMMNMTDADKKALRDRIINNGAVINKDAALYEATNAGARKQNEAIFNLYKQGNLTASTVADTQGEYADSIKAGARANQAAAVAAANSGSEAAQSIAKNNLDGLNQTTKINKASVAAAKGAVKGQEETKDPLTKKVNEIETSAQNFKVALEEELTPAIGKFADQLMSSSEKLNSMLDSLGLKNKTTGEKVGGAVGGATGATAGAGLGAWGGAAAGAAIGSVVPVLGTAIGGIIGGLLGAAGGAGLGWMGGQKAGEGAAHMMGAGNSDRKLAGGDFIRKPERVIVGDGGNEYVMPESKLDGVAAKLYNDMASMMPMGKMKDKSGGSGMFDGMASKLGSMASIMPGPIGLAAKAATSMFGDESSNSSSGGSDMSDLLKEQNGLMKEQMDKYNTMIDRLTDSSTNIERLMHSMS